MRITFILFVLISTTSYSQSNDKLYAFNQKIYKTSPRVVSKVLENEKVLSIDTLTGKTAMDSLGSFAGKGIIIIRTHPPYLKTTSEKLLGHPFKTGNGKLKYEFQGKLYDSPPNVDINDIEAIKEMGQLNSCRKYKDQGVNNVAIIILKK